jgi:hypothetical protein
MGSYMAEIMPTVQSQIMKAAQAAEQEVKASASPEKK